MTPDSSLCPLHLISVLFSTLNTLSLHDDQFTDFTLSLDLLLHASAPPFADDLPSL